MGAFSQAFARINTRNADVDKEIADADLANAKKAQAAGYLCGECAELLGGRWPKGHRATFHPATCPLCQVCRPIASWDDWSWPKTPEIDRWANETIEI